MSTDIKRSEIESESRTVPPLRNGDRLSQTEFLRRYAAMPNVRHAELVEGRVIIPAPVSADKHGEPHFDFVTWLGVYRAMTPGVIGGDNSTLKLDLDNAPQPDGYLRLAEDCGGQSRLRNGYLEGAPELIVEVSASSASYDLHDKRTAYRRNGVREYVVWRTEDGELDWFILRGGDFDRLPPGDDQVYRSEVFPGLWLDPTAVLGGNLARVLEVLHQGLTHPSHRDFVESRAPDRT